MGEQWAVGAPPPDAALTLAVGTAWAPDGTPSFHAASRDRLALDLGLTWSPAPVLAMDLGWGLARERSAVGPALLGPQALRLGTRLLALRQPRAPLDASLGWQASLPWSADQGALGTDETDVSLAGSVGRAFGTVRADLGLGLAIRGNPLRLAGQDDIPLLWGRGEVQRGPVALHARAGGELGTARNPARLQALAGIATACPWRLEAEGGAGLSPAAPSFLLQVTVGWSWACRVPAGD